MTFNVATITHNTESEAFITLLDGGSCELRTGSQPALVTDAATGTLIATIVLPATALSAPAAAGTADLAVTTEVAVVAGGTIGWARFKKSDASTVFDGSVTLSGGGGDIIATLLIVVATDLVNIVSMSYTRS